MFVVLAVLLAVSCALIVAGIAVAVGVAAGLVSAGVLLAGWAWLVLVDMPENEADR